MIEAASGDADLLGGAYSEPPTLRDSRVVEGTRMRAIRVEGAPEVRFRAFLDGIQRVRIVSHERGVPILYGTVAAVVRERVNRRFVTWKRRAPLVRHAVYVPMHYLPQMRGWNANGTVCVDTSAADVPSRHPGALRAVALECIRADREAVERQLAEEWCLYEADPLFIDGSIRGSDRIATAECVVGVVKSHQTLYAQGEALEVIFSLRIGERSSVFQVEPGRRAGVMSWYLRVRDPRGRDALFGLVRVEVAEPPAGGMGIAARANDVSRWVLAEASPLSLPDSRWDTMMYGVRDCEEFLRAIAS
jgi:hypothetical protein